MTSGPAPNDGDYPIPVPQFSPKNQTPYGEGSLTLKDKRKLLALNGRDGDRNGAGDSLAESRSLSPTSASTFLPSPPLTMSPPERRPSPRGSPRLYPVGTAASPSRLANRSASPGLHSPASSQIFERNVQEPESLPAIPAHIQTEDHIPAALDASSIAITDDHLNPDEVEIIMHPAHQPASVVVANSVHDSMYAAAPSHDESAALSHSDILEAGTGPSYASLDTTDPRRLSFISFADVVQAEHAEQSDADRDGVQILSLSQTANRSPSPMRSPATSHAFGSSPPATNSSPDKGVGTRSPGSPSARGALLPFASGELQVETMRQALRRTGSGDLSGVRSPPLSAVSLDEAPADRAPFK